MELTFRRAEPCDLDEIALLVDAAIKRMTERRIFQWDDVYPAKDDFARDIRRRELYAGTIGGRIAVVYALSRESNGQYASGAWQYTGDDYLVLHRLCVSPDFQNKGIARKTMRHIEEDSARRGAKAIRLDAFLGNPIALRLYSESGYRTAGSACWRKGPFVLLEKVLDAEPR